MENMTINTTYWVGTDFWENVRTDIAFVRSVNTIAVTREVVFKYHAALKEDRYWESVYDQLGKVKFICMTALLSEMQCLIAFDRQLKRNDPELVNEIVELFQAILALKDAVL